MEKNDNEQGMGAREQGVDSFLKARAGIGSPMGAWALAVDYVSVTPRKGYTEWTASAGGWRTGCGHSYGSNPCSLAECIAWARKTFPNATVEVIL